MLTCHQNIQAIKYTQAVVYILLSCCYKVLFKLAPMNKLNILDLERLYQIIYLSGFQPLVYKNTYSEVLLNRFLIPLIYLT